jgi:hypothetical protein
MKHPSPAVAKGMAISLKERLANTSVMPTLPSYSYRMLLRRLTTLIACRSPYRSRTTRLTYRIVGVPLPLHNGVQLGTASYRPGNHRFSPPARCIEGFEDQVLDGTPAICLSTVHSSHIYSMRRVTRGWRRHRLREALIARKIDNPYPVSLPTRQRRRSSHDSTRVAMTLKGNHPVGTLPDNWAT